ncbi:hypothetical protein Tsubulata_007139, partial [Turnera subulata]
MFEYNRIETVIEGDDGWDTVSDNGDESEWFPGVEDPLIRNPLVEFKRHLMQTKGFDIDMKNPYDLNSGIIRPVPFEYSNHLGRIKELASFAVQLHNKKKKKKGILRTSRTRREQNLMVKTATMMPTMLLMGAKAALADYIGKDA